MSEITSIEGFDFSDMTDAIADVNRLPLEPGMYLAVVNKVTIVENEENGNVFFVFDLRINKNSDVLDYWDEAAGTVRHSSRAWYGRRTEHGWAFDKNGKPGFMPAKFFSALGVKEMNQLDLVGQTGKLIKILIGHEEYQGQVRLAVKNVWPFVENGVTAPRLPGFEDALAAQEFAPEEDAF